MVFKLRGRLLNVETSDTKPRCTRNAPGLLLVSVGFGRRPFHFFLSESSFLMRFHARGPKCQL